MDAIEDRKYKNINCVISEFIDPYYSKGIFSEELTFNVGYLAILNKWRLFVGFVMQGHNCCRLITKCNGLGNHLT